MLRLRDAVSGRPMDWLEEGMLRDSDYWMDEWMRPGTLRYLGRKERKYTGLQTAWEYLGPPSDFKPAVLLRSALI